MRESAPDPNLSLNGGQRKKYGFWRNIYVLAADIGEAKTKARLSQISEINRDANLGSLRSLTADDLVVGSVNTSYEPWKLIFREGVALPSIRWIRTRKKVSPCLTRNGHLSSGTESI